MSLGLPNGSEGVLEPDEAENALQQVLIRLTSPQLKNLQIDLVGLREQINALKNIEGENTGELRQRLEETNALIDAMEKKFLRLEDELHSPSMIGERLETTIVPALHHQVRNQGEDVAEALAPVIGPAIRRQIRDAKEDIIDALYPLIGQIIGKAISEALRELTRNIDTRLRKQLNFRERMNQVMARLRGVSETELLMRGALPYSLEHVFLVHRETGLLLSHISAERANRANMDTISGMLTAIQDFVRDSFSDGEGNLEEITHGGRRILLESGHYAYLAVVLSGIEPVGYNNLIREVINEVHLRYESDLKRFDGNMHGLTDFEPVLMPLLSPPMSAPSEKIVSKPLSGPQKRLWGFGVFGLLFLIALLLFACIFVIRLWPLAFPGTVALPTATFAFLPSPTSTPIPSQTPTASPSPTFTTQPSETATIPPSSTPSPVTGILTGNLNVRMEPSSDAAPIGVITAGEKVTIQDHQGNWYLVAWPVEGRPKLEGWINGEKYFDVTGDLIP
jgi:Bacterial SH3 domain